jgi:hypothetical protein
MDLKIIGMSLMAMLLLSGCNAENICVETGQLTLNGSSINPARVQIHMGKCSDGEQTLPAALYETSIMHTNGTATVYNVTAGNNFTFCPSDLVYKSIPCECHKWGCALECYTCVDKNETNTTVIDLVG